MVLPSYPSKNPSHASHPSRSVDAGTAVDIDVSPKPIRLLLSFDFEWSLIKDKHGEHPMLAAGFVDSNGVKSALLLEDFIDKEVSPERQRSRAEKALLLKIVRIINKYDWSIGFYSTGIRAYNQWKHKTVGRDSDLIQLHRRLERYGIMSIVKQGRFSQIPYLSGYNNTHTHVDAYRLFTNQAIKVSVYGNSYSANDLDTISRAIVKRGKHGGLSGLTLRQSLIWNRSATMSLKMHSC